MRLGLFTLCVLTLLFIAAKRGGADGSGKPPKAPRFAHASVAAYPNAVLSLKDPKTGLIFYVESDGRRLVALDKDGALVWGFDVLDEAKVNTHRLGAPVVRHLSLHGDKLWAVCGKSETVSIDVETGKVLSTTGR
jgi:outer membrane protein assembly factor BamB